MKKRPTNDDSDEFDVDEPEEFEESGSDWDPEEEEAGKKRKGKAKITPKKPTNNKKKKIEKPSLEAEENDENEEEEDEVDEDSDEEDTEVEQTNGITANSNASVRAFTNGSFVVLKSDIQAKENPPLWKIDGKALLQKYVPFEQNGKILYKNTSTYSGWTPSNQDQYAPAPVTYVEHGKKEIIIEFNKSILATEESLDKSKSESLTTAEA